MLREQRSAALRTLRAGTVRGVWSAWLLLAFEFAVVMLAQRREVASVWEVQWGVTWLVPTALGISGVLGALGGLFVSLLAHSEARPVRLTVAAILGFFAGIFAWQIGGGRHLATLAARGGFAFVVGGSAAILTYWGTKHLRSPLQKRPLLVASATLVTIVVLELINRFVLFRLYPAFHLGLSFAALLLAPLLGIALAEHGARLDFPGRRLALSMLALVVAFVALAKPTAHKLSYFDNFRLLLGENAPILGQAVTIAAALAPPAPYDQTSCDPGPEGSLGAGCFDDSAQQAVVRTIDLRERDVLLVSIDALRADHVGAYGYSRPTTPNLDALAKEGALFESAYAATPHTSYSITSLMTGKYMRPLLLQNAAHDSDTWASLFRTYGFRTAAFYPPAVFFIDPSRFESFSKSYLGFEYRWVEFAEGERRIAQVRDYLASAPRDKPLFIWVHLFSPHEPYEAHPEHDFGKRDVDRYDSEIAASDKTLGELVKLFRTARPKNTVIVTADHGEEFGEHGGRYHGTSVYEEQVRVPLVISAPGSIKPHRIREPVQTIDVLPTLLTALDIPRPPRLRGRDLGPIISGKQADSKGLAHAETEEQTLLAEGSLRLVCARKLGACQLFDLKADPSQTRDLSRERPNEFNALRSRLRELTASHGLYEQSGLRAEGKGWPPAILRGISGDADAAEEIAALLDDADAAIRRKAAELLFELSRPETTPALRLALSRDEDAKVRKYSALALTRLGEGAPLVYELLEDSEQNMRRLAALALAQSGDRRGEKILVSWWQDASTLDFARSRELIDVFANLKTKDAVWPLVQRLDDVRLRPYIAEALAKMDSEVGRAALLKIFPEERLQSTRAVIARALVELEAEEAIAPALKRFLGVPDPLPGGLELAMRAGVLEYVGGPAKKDLSRLQRQANLGVGVMITVPGGGNGKGVRALVRARCSGSQPGEVLIGVGEDGLFPTGKQKRKLPQLVSERSLRFRVPQTREFVELFATLPESVGAKPGWRANFVVFADSTVELEAFALVPLADELPPPPPKPWKRE